MKTDFERRKISTAVFGFDSKYLALGLAFVICLLVIAGMRAASAVGPSQTPPAGAVSPNFSSITVNGTSTFNSGVSILGPIKNPPNPYVIVGDDLKVDGGLIVSGLTTLNGVDAQGPIKNTLGNPVVVGTDLAVEGHVSNPGNDKLILDDDVKVTGDLDLKGEISSLNSDPSYTYDFVVTPTHGSCKVRVLRNATEMYQETVSDTGGDGSEKVYMTVDGDYLSTTISFPACTANPASRTIDPGDVRIADGLRVAGNLDVIGDIVGLETTNEFDNLIVNNALDLKGKMENSDAGTVTFGGITVSTAPITFDGDLNLTSPGNLKLQGKILNESPGAPVGVFDDLTVYGKARATQFGDYVQESSSTYKKINNGAFATTSVSCSAGTLIISCGATAYGTTWGLYFKKYDVPLTRIYSDIGTNTCHVAAKTTRVTQGI